MTDSIVKHVRLAASQERVWRAISTASEFGEWFGLKAEAEFAEGATVPATITGEEGRNHPPFVLLIDTIQPPERLVFRWHHHQVDLGGDYAGEPTTTVEFVLREVAGGVELTITESGFDNLPAEARAEALKRNEGGWTYQIANIQKYVER